MTLHLRKLCVGAESIDDLAFFVERRVRLRKAEGLSPHGIHDTRMWPKREGELLDGGSLYWIIKGVMCVRQTLAGMEETFNEHGVRHCRLLLEPELVRVEPRPHRPFQGWRYLKPDEAPRDLSGSAADLEPELAKELSELGLI